MNTLVKVVDRNEFNVSEVIATTITKAFLPAVEKMKELSPAVLAVFEMEDGVEKSKEAKKNRLLLVKVRTATAKIHKSEKAEYAGIGKYCDAWKNAQLEVGQEIEAQLKEIEDVEEIRAKKELDELTAEREALIEPYLADDATLPENLGNLDENTFQVMLAGLKAVEKMKGEAEEKEEKTRIEKEQDDEIQKLQDQRIYQTTKLSEFIPDYEDQNFGIMSKDEFMAVVNPAIKLRDEKEAKDKADAEELERLRTENKEQAEALQETTNEVEKLEEEKKELEIKHEESVPNNEGTVAPASVNANDTDELKMKRFMRGFLALSEFKFEQADMKAMHDKFAPKCINTVNALEKMFNIKL